MPLYSYGCEAKHTTDILCKFEEKPVAVPCDVCGISATAKLTMPARTSGRWGDSGGGYDHSLGRHFDNPLQKEAYCKANGLVALSDLGSGNEIIESEIHKEITIHEAHEKNLSNYQETLRKTGDAGVAAAQTFTVENMKASGLLDSSVNG